MCGARFSVHGARGLYAAARRAGLRDEDVATETQRMRALGRMLQLPAPRGTTLQVSALDVPSNFLSRDVSRAVFDERVAVALSLIGAPAVRRHVTKVTMHLPTAGWCLYEPFELMEALCNAEQLHTLHLVLSASDEAADNDDMFYAVAKLRWSGEDLQRRSGENLRRLSLPGCAFATNAITSLAGSQLDKLTDLLVCARANVPAHLRTLATTSTLRNVDLSGSCIRTVSLERLCGAITSSSNLRLEQLRLNRVQMTDHGGQVFAMERNRRPCSVTLGDMLGSNTTLRSLKLGGAAQLSQCFICQSVGTYRYGMWLKDTTFSSGLACNRTLRILSFKNLYFLEKLGASIALALRSNTGLRELTMEGAGISTKDGALLAESLRLNDGLQHVSLNENPSLCGETLPQFSRVVKQHRKPQRLDILGHTYHGEAGLGMPMRPVDGPGPAT
ncbi:unnamed protein product [Pedinophyceae sp. YPF-701]|nr:unnamed protein product [Pedinophyceae sp. YPF-701]